MMEEARNNSISGGELMSRDRPPVSMQPPEPYVVHHHLNPEATERDKSNGERIVACVNACAGMDDPAAEIKRLREIEWQYKELCK